MPRSVRYRRCPGCQVVSPALTFRRSGGPIFAARDQLRRQCPACGCLGPTLLFPLVEQPPPDQEQRR
jgi:hypothetical protein